MSTATHAGSRLDRSRARRVLGVALAVCASALAPTALGVPPAHAADARTPVPADAPTVATTAGGYALLAWVKGGSVCTAIQRAGRPRPASSPTGPAAFADGDEEGGCEHTPVLARFGVRVFGGSAPDGRRMLIWGATGAGAARLALKTPTALLDDVTTSAPVLGGAASELRFWVSDVSTSALPDELAARDDTGALRFATTFEDASGTSGSEFGDSDTGRPAGTLVQRGRAGRTRWQLRRLVDRPLRPTPLAVERRITQSCLLYSTDGPLVESTGAGGLCDDALAGDEVLASDVGNDCNLGLHVDVIAPAGTRRVVAVLGDGRRRAIPLVALGDAGARAGSLVVGFGTAVRRLIALGTGDRTLGTEPIGVPPLLRITELDRCGRVLHGIGDVPSPAAAPERLGAGPHVLHAADDGDRLCVAADRLAPAPADCAVPAADPTQVRLRALTTADGRLLFGVVPAEVAAARVTLTDRTTRTFAAAPLAGYAGLYASVVRQVTADVPGRRPAVRVELLDDRGRVINPWAGSDAPVVGRARTLLPAASGGPALRIAPATTYGFGPKTSPCLSFRVPVALGDCDTPALSGWSGAETIQLWAPCAARRLDVSALLAHRSDRLVVQTAGGREVDARRARIPTGSGAAAGRYAALAMLGPHERATRIILRGRAGRSVPVALPPAAQQCGYGYRVDGSGLLRFGT